MLVQALRAASRAMGTYSAAEYRRLVERPDAKHAPVAVGHTLLVMTCQVLKKEGRSTPSRVRTTRTASSRSGCHASW